MKVKERPAPLLYTADGEPVRIQRRIGFLARPEVVSDTHDPGSGMHACGSYYSSDRDFGTWDRAKRGQKR